MNLLSLPWVEWCIAMPLGGALVVALMRDPVVAARWTLGISLGVLVFTCVPWVAYSEGIRGGKWFAVDGFTAPLLPVLSLMHFLTVLATARVKLNRMSLVGHLAGQGIHLATFAAASASPWVLMVFLAIGTIPPLMELRKRGTPTHIYVAHMAAFVILLAASWATNELGANVAGSILLLLAILVRSGTLPAHLWVADLFEHATFGTAILFFTPLIAVYACLRLVLPGIPDWALQSLLVLSLISAIYAAGMATIQQEGRRFFAYLFLSHASFVMSGLAIQSFMTLTGAFCLWLSVMVSLAGLGLTLRAVEARFGRLNLNGHRGLYDQSPSLAICFLLTGLGSVGFPGTLGFIATEMLVDGAIEANPVIGVALVAAAALNGIAVLRAYLLLFTGARLLVPLQFQITPRERIAVLTLAFLVVGGGIAPQLTINSRQSEATAVLHRREASSATRP